MRHLAIAAGIAFATMAATPALADKAPWCAQFGGSAQGGGTECLYYSFAQCQATLSGMGGRCFPNPWVAEPPQENRSDYRRRY